MTCGMAQGTELRFTESGIRIQPNSVDYESDKTEYDFIRAQISRAAGDHINEYGSVPEAVEVIVGSKKLCDVFLGQESLTLDDDRAHLELYDCRKVLERGIIDRQIHSTTLGNIVDWFAEEVDGSDTGNVITGVEIVGEDVDREEVTEDFVQSYDMSLPGQQDGDADEAGPVELAIRKFGAWETRLVNGLGPLEGREEGGFDFDQINMAQALALIQDRFQLESFIGEDRVLKIGEPEIEANLYFAGEGRNMWHVSDYNLTSNPNHVRMVQVKGGYVSARSLKEEGKREEVRATENGKAQMWAFASTEKPKIFDDDTIHLDEVNHHFGQYKPVEGKVVPVLDPETTHKMSLKKLAVRRLMKEIIHSMSGSITVNPVKSSIKGGYPHDIKVGDSLALFPPEGQKCKHGTIPESLFVVNGVRHELDGKTGWEMTLDLSKVVEQDIYAAAHAWPTIPDAGSEYEDYKEYYTKTMEYDYGSYTVTSDSDEE